MKPKSKSKKLLIVLISLVLVGAIGAGAFFYFGKSSAEPVNVFPFINVGMTEYWGDSQESYGFVETDKIQTVFLSDTQTVTQVLVAQGDVVKKGDVLMTFDTTLSDLALERERLKVEKLKLQLQEAQERLREINSMRPMVIPQPSEDEDTDESLGEILTDSFRISHNSEYDGSSSEKALICWLNSASAIDEYILESLRLKAEEYQAANREKPQEPADPSQPPQPEESVQVNGFYVVFKITGGNREMGTRITWQGMHVRRYSGGSFNMRFFDGSQVPDHMLSPDQEEGDKLEIDYGSGFTAAQIAEMRSEQEKTIKSLEFEIKMAEADYKIKQTEASDGKVYAQVDGVVAQLLPEEEAKLTQQPMIKISGGGGFYIEGSISELDKETLVMGQEVTINDWQTGMMYTGTIQSVGDYPQSGNGWNGLGNPNASYYPFRVFVDESADLQAGRYVSIVFSAGAGEHGIYLENPFIRREKGQSYVYVRGTDGRLEQRFVTLGKSLWGSYTEILSGLGEEDRIAFPYGKHVKPGAETVESDIGALYE